MIVINLLNANAIVSQKSGKTLTNATSDQFEIQLIIISEVYSNLTNYGRLFESYGNGMNVLLVRHQNELLESGTLVGEMPEPRGSANQFRVIRKWARRVSLKNYPVRINTAPIFPENCSLKTDQYVGHVKDTQWTQEEHVRSIIPRFSADVTIFLRRNLKRNVTAVTFIFVEPKTSSKSKERVAKTGLLRCKTLARGKFRYISALESKRSKISYPRSSPNAHPENIPRFIL